MFIEANDMFFALTNVNKEKGLGDVSSYPPIVEADMKKLRDFFKATMYGNPDPRVLQHIVIFNIIYYLFCRCCENLRQIQVTTFGLAVDPDNNLNYIFQ